MLNNEKNGKEKRGLGNSDVGSVVLLNVLNRKRKKNRLFSCYSSIFFRHCNITNNRRSINVVSLEKQDTHDDLSCGNALLIAFCCCCFSSMVEPRRVTVSCKHIFSSCINEYSVKRKFHDNKFFKRFSNNDKSLRTSYRTSQRYSK